MYAFDGEKLKMLYCNFVNLNVYYYDDVMHIYIFKISL